MPKAVETNVDEDEDKDSKGNDDALVVVEDPPSKGARAESEEDDDESDDDEDEESPGNQKDEGDEEKEARLGGGRDEEDDDPKRTQREKNRSRRQQQRESRDRNFREMAFLRKRNEDLERQFSTLSQNVDQRITGNEIGRVDAAIAKAKADIALAEQVITQAIEQSDGKNATEAMNHRDAIRDNLKELEEAKEYLTQARQAPQQPPPLDPRHVAHAQSFMVDHSWWDTKGGDDDSKKVLEIDRSLVREGFDPVSKEYWDELRSRVKEALPEKFGSRKRTKEVDEDLDADEPPTNGKAKVRNNKGPEFRTAGRERPLRKNEVYISPERKAAMVDAGVWDDPVLRNRFLKSYQKYDREAKESQGA